MNDSVGSIDIKMNDKLPLPCTKVEPLNPMIQVLSSCVGAIICSKSLNSRDQELETQYMFLSIQPQPSCQLSVMRFHPFLWNQISNLSFRLSPCQTNGGGRAYFFNAPYHQGAIKMLCSYFCGAFMFWAGTKSGSNIPWGNIIISQPLQICCIC